MSAAPLRRALLLCSLSLACGGLQQQEGLCETQQLQCSEGYCSDTTAPLGMLPTCESAGRPYVRYGYAVPAQPEPLVPGSVEARTPEERTVRYLGFEAAAGQRYRFQLVQNTGVDTRLLLLDASGQSSDAGVTRDSLSFELLQQHTSQRYVVVLSFKGAANAPYSYRFERVPESGTGAP